MACKPGAKGEAGTIILSRAASNNAGLASNAPISIGCTRGAPAKSVGTKAITVVSPPPL